MPDRRRVGPARVAAAAPTRIDLAGGTIDLWPLHLLHDQPLTINAAIDQFARATVEATAGPGVEIVAADRGARLRADGFGDLPTRIDGAPGTVEFPLRLAAHFLAPLAAAGVTGGCRVTTDCQAPAGSGLGGSSTLGIALATALARYTGRAIDPDRILALTRAIETQVLRIPTGEQDYHPAIHGGVLALHYTVEGTRVERLAVDPEALHARTVLVYTGQPRSSGLSNWDMMKRHLDGDAGVRESLAAINRAAHAMRGALLAADWQAAGGALAAEWEARKRLSPLVTTPEIDSLIDAARSAGAQAGKVCGAGGGGCLVLWTPADRRDAAARKVTGLGARVLDFRYVSSGVTVTET
jgi:D-glycero-alpha-D-manno-heptose-7-phosphate kinase